MDFCSIHFDNLKCNLMPSRWEKAIFRLLGNLHTVQDHRKHYCERESRKRKLDVVIGNMSIYIPKDAQLMLLNAILVIYLTVIILYEGQIRVSLDIIAKN
eukprot:snap_masked-scaffold_22-processed-gene-1.29-mRNA-1 protein AED:1.00 eAED:1.00 QI:0/0/0/0/1/1/2/0/99